MLIVAALKEEIRELKAKMAINVTIHFKPAILYRGTLFSRDVELLVTGIGAERTRKGLLQALDQVAPDLILHVGFAGGASPIASVASLILSERVIEEKSEKYFVCEKNLLGRAKQVCEANQLAHHLGGLVTVGHVVSDPHQKAVLGTGHGALAIDMEVAAVAQLASERGIPWLVVKSILDPVEMVLPNLENCITPVGEAKPFAIAEHLFKTPGDLMKFPQIQYQASQARETIAKFVEGWMGRV